MSTAPHSGPGLKDLEKELTCSICTDLLYQPLTLLNCLHTFCGSCLKEWFAVQGTRSRPSSSARFTCPSCRATVRDTRPNATVTTLLDMVLAASPDRGKSAAEKEEVAQRYKPGDSVFPSTDAGSDAEDRRVLEEVRALSLQDSRSGYRQQQQQQRSRHSSRSRHRRMEGTGTDSDERRREEDGRSRRRREGSSRRQPRRTTAGEEGPERSTRRVEHQSSLRSLLSLSDTETMQEEILRQIFEEGLLDDIDLDNMGPSQEEELSERIADAYRRRHRLRARSQQQRTEPRENSQTPSSRPRARSQSVQRAENGTGAAAMRDTRESNGGPPVSRPYLLDPLVARDGHSGHQRRLSDQGGTRTRRRTSPVPVGAASSSEVSLRPAARSSSDMVADRPRNSQTGRVRTAEASAASRSRRATASEQNVPNIWVEGARERQLRPSGRSSIDSPRVATALNHRGRNGSWPSSPDEPSTASPPTSSLVAEVGVAARQEPRSRPSSSRSNAPPRSATLYMEPSIKCDRCDKPNIQHDLHKKCPTCNNGNFYLCLRCYRTGRGCLNWAGFGASAKADLERIRASSTGEPRSPIDTSHILQSCKYLRAPESAYRSDRDGRMVTNDDPARRLQTGLFCDSCHSSANDCLWRCNQCNEGDWGFCNRCVNQGRCCTHALLPICRITRDSPLASPTGAFTIAPNGASNDCSDASGSGTEIFKILSFTTNCDICTHPIPASTLRFHCLVCNDGDYDICANCYLRLVATGKIRKENGHNGWRRCIKGHRMIVVGFEDHDEGQRRVIVRDLVGGCALNDDHLQQPSSSPFAVPTPTSIHATASTPGTPNSPFPHHTTPFSSSAATGTGPGIASPEFAPGDWLWKEGSERRKKASRLRPWPLGGERDRTALTSPPSSEPSTPNTPTFAAPVLPTSAVPASASRRFPPDGGVGLIVHALWSWYPEDSVKDELMFPRGAEITEAENINDDWYWGCYAGLTGLFPGSHVHVVDEVV
ncbi:SH3 domain protein [Aspergillus brunneoviolaceus CBS 621.78]|uniref:Uncharacterized protein n=1 Tax=Aspergillus brunneoviolaceus CBS 621.78 TaxID=1450534 RepID=A0ACD1GH74_9EURO|nr:hypothetical protein BO95DRAFT_440072 [Aspergillus brunneoviolaceus CBS 621.78]RAH48590.1 hypothetical protein BO95DRAFT_440072 [Aspergillus brunneoviolaceus CBS 621.78]